MKSLIKNILVLKVLTLFLAIAFVTGCQQSENSNIQVKVETPEYFSLRPDVEKAYGYTHAVKIGDDIKISGAVSMDDTGNPTQMVI